MHSRWHWSCTLDDRLKGFPEKEFQRGKMPETALITLLLAGSLLAPAPAHADMKVGISVAPQTLVSSPRLVAVPGSSVFHAPHEPYALFAYAGRYYSFHRGSWFRSAGPANAWSLIATDQVPNAVLAVPRAFARAPESPAATAAPTR
jgi:hypothetical protein